MPRIPVVVTPNQITPEEYAKKLGISKKRFTELKTITDKVLTEVLSRQALEAAETGCAEAAELEPNGLLKPAARKSTKLKSLNATKRQSGNRG